MVYICPKYEKKMIKDNSKVTYYTIDVTKSTIKTVKIIE